MRLTRHNGRAGKHGTYNPKHNDRSFDLENSEHINAELAKKNVYWDCYNGFRSLAKEELLADTFEEVEEMFYSSQYRNHVESQNQRNEKNRHPERNRTTSDLLKNKKTAPEETIFQIGTIDNHVPPEILLQVVTDFLVELDTRFGKNVHILDWALHLDEGTPHIHERHVFDCENSYGEVAPQQEKALEELGFELPDPTQKPSKINNRKKTFDSVCRVILFNITKKYGLDLEEEPEYGGRAYLEKQDYMEIIHTIIHPIFTLAVRDNYIRINPATGAMAEIKKSHNWEKPKRHALTIAEQTAFIDYMRNHKVYNHWLPLFTVLLGTGCRIGEAIGLRWEDCDFDEGIISINHNMVYRKYEEDEKARFHIVTPKTSAGVRIVPMLSEVKAALQAEWETQKIVGFNESVVDGYTGFIFQNRYGDPLSPHSVNRAIDRICAAYIEDETVLADQEGRDPVLIRHFSAHNLRHTFCMRFCENERNIKVIQEIMGHADIETTMNIYAEATKEKKKESFSNLEGKIKIS